MSREEEIVQKTIDVLKQQLNHPRIILFGSRAKGTAHHGSDFDFALDMSKPDSLLNRRVCDNIEIFSGLYGVDLIFLDDVNPKFKKLVLTTGKIVYER